MSNLTRSTLSAGGLLARLLAGWLLRYFGWLGLTAFLTLSGAAVLMLFKYWTINAMFTSAMVWPALGLASVVAFLIAFLPFGRLWLYSAMASAGLYNLILLIA
jgi:hypothetical protein